MNQTEKMVEFVLNTNYEDLPKGAIEVAKGCILDCIGVSLAGYKQPIGKILDSYIDQIGGNSQATIIGSGIKTSVANAALVNGTLGHALDFDDTTLPAISHPTTTILPSILAIGEYVKASGKEMLLAFIVGFEIFNKIASVVNPSHWYRGYHSTGTFGAFGSVAAAAKLLKLNEIETTHAFGIAASLTSGLKQNIGSMTKPFHAGHASESGVRAALLAKAGFTSKPDAFEGRMGYTNVMASEPDFKHLDKLGETWEIIDPAPFIKPHPSCAGTHAAMNALLSLINEYDIKNEDVEKIEAGMNPGALEQLIYSEPKDALEAKFSMQYCLAILLLERKWGLSQHTDEKVSDPITKIVMKKVHLYVDEELSEILPLEWVDKTAIVKVTMNNGNVYERKADLPQFTFDEIMEKYLDCASLILSEEKLEKSIEVIKNFESITDVSNLMEIIQK